MRILNILEKYDPTMSVAELMEKIKNDEAEKEAAIIAEDNAIFKKYKGAYLKRFHTSPFWGKTFEVIHIERIEFETYTTEWNRLYEVKGTMLSFSRTNIGKQNDCGKFLLQDFESFEKIERSEFNIWKERWNAIQKTLADIIIFES